MNLDAFTVATFNLYNLQLPGAPMNPGQRPWTEAEYSRKLRWTADALREIRADVVGLQELWSADAIRAVLERANLDDDYTVLAEPADGSRIVCAALVRTELLSGEPRWIDAFPAALRLESTDAADDPQAPDIHVAIDGFSRPVLRFEMRPRDDEQPIVVFVTHLKSKLPTRIDAELWFRDEPETYRPHRTAIGAALSTIRRTAEAAALRVLLTETMKGTETPVIVLGDVNDGKLSNTVNILTEQPNYLVGEQRGGADNGLYTAQTLQEYRDTRDVYYTHVHQRFRESLDHVLVSEQLYDHSRKRRWLFDDLRILNDHLDVGDHREHGSGDHGIVAVRFAHHPFR